MAARKKKAAKKRGYTPAGKKAAKKAPRKKAAVKKPAAERWSERERRFVEHMDACGNGTLAAIRAKYSEKTAGVQAHDLLKKPKIRRALDELAKDRRDRLRADADLVLEKLLTICGVTISDFIDEKSGALLETFEDVPEAALEAVQSLKQKSYMDDDGIMHTETEVKLVDRLKGIQLLGNHRDIQAFLVKIDAGGDFADMLNRAKAADKARGGRD